jgi:hypothetical protein
MADERYQDNSFGGKRYGETYQDASDRQQRLADAPEVKNINTGYTGSGKSLLPPVSFSMRDKPKASWFVMYLGYGLLLASVVIWYFGIQVDVGGGETLLSITTRLGLTFLVLAYIPGLIILFIAGLILLVLFTNSKTLNGWLSIGFLVLVALVIIRFFVSPLPKKSTANT